MLYRQGSKRNCCIAENENHFVSLAVELANNDTCRQEAREELIELRPHLFEDSRALAEWSSFLNIAVTSSLIATRTSSNITSFNRVEPTIVEQLKTVEDIQSNNRISLILNSLSQHANNKWVESAREVIVLTMDFIGCDDSGRVLMWRKEWAEQSYEHSCYTLRVALDDSIVISNTEVEVDKVEVDKIEVEVKGVNVMANHMQEVSGCLLWIYQSFETKPDSYSKTEEGKGRAGWWNKTVGQVIDFILTQSSQFQSLERQSMETTGQSSTSIQVSELDMSVIAALSSLFAHCALKLNPKLINAAAFGSAALTRIDAYDHAADLYTLSAHLKRHYFGFITNHMTDHTLYNMDTKTNTVNTYINSQDREYLSEEPDWQAMARKNPLFFASLGSKSRLMEHPSTAFDLGADDGGVDREMRPFRRIQFGG